MRVDELLTEKEKGILDVTKDFFKSMVSNDAPEKQYKEYLDFAVKKMNYTRDKDLVVKLKKQFPELAKNNTDLIRVMRDVKKLRNARG